MAKSQALKILNEIKAATFKNAAQLPLKESAQAEWQGLGYQVGGLRLVSNMNEISEILKMPRYAALPGVKSWILGIANVRGRLLPIIDLHDYFSMPPTLPMMQWRVLVIEDEDIAAGLVVEQSLGIQHFLEDSFEETTAEGATALQPYIRGAFRHGGRMFYETHLKSILRDEKFFDVVES
ncbi:MAG: chemotaxis protein CheW [Gammaproteobacteria bacterium]|jgi:twitching motility protein PilI|nr:chemotaxis protein CheW [Gammaproteobacteria bacterium]